MPARDDDEFAPTHRRSPGLVGMLVDLGVRQVQRLPSQVTRLPVVGLNAALVGAEALRRELAEARKRGGGVLEIGHAALKVVQAVRDGNAIPLRDEGAVQAEAADIARAARETSQRAVTEAKQAARESAALQAQVSHKAQDVGAPGAATAVAERASAEVRGRAGSAEPPSRDELPIADFDSATLASLRARLRRLTLEELVMLRDYEQAHAKRLPVVTMLENRIARVRQADRTAAGAPGGTVRP